MINDNFIVTTDFFDSVLGKCKLICTAEFLQDLAFHSAMLDTPKTGEFSESEVDGWHSAMKQLDEMDWEGAYKRVKIEP